MERNTCSPFFTHLMCLKCYVIQWIFWFCLYCIFSSSDDDLLKSNTNTLISTEHSSFLIDIKFPLKELMRELIMRYFLLLTIGFNGKRVQKRCQSYSTHTLNVYVSYKTYGIGIGALTHTQR